MKMMTEKRQSNVHALIWVLYFSHRGSNNFAMNTSYFQKSAVSMFPFVTG